MWGPKLADAIDEDALIVVIQAFGAAVVDPSRWLKALAVTCDALGAVGCSIELVDLNTGIATLESPLELENDVVAHYNERIFHINPRVNRALESEVGSIVSDPELLPQDHPNAPEFLDWLARTPARYTQGAKLLDQSAQIVFYNAHYSKGQGPAGADHRRFHRFLVPQLINFIHAGRALNESRLRNELVTHHALDGAKPFALLNAAGDLMESSAGFQTMLRDNRLLGYRNGRLTALHSQHREMVEQFLRKAGDAGRFLDPPLPIRLSGPDNPKGLVLRAVPLSPREDIFDTFRPTAMLTLTDLDEPMKTRRRELVSLFSLTEREADVAALIGEGSSTERAAQQLGISYHTVRQHIKAVFGKMHIERQSELVAIIGRLT